MKKYILLIVAILILIGAAFYGNSINKMDATIVEGYYREILPEASEFEFITDSTAKVYGEDGQLTCYIGLGSDIGYGGPLVVAAVIDLEGKIESVTVVEHKETLAYLAKIAGTDYYRQYKSKTVEDSLVPLYDIDCVSGATLSTKAIGNSVREVAHEIAAGELGITPKKAKINWQIGIAEIAIALLFVAGLILARIRKLGKYRIPLLLSSVVILGFWLNRAPSIAQISALFLGYFPAPQTNLIWYMVLLGAMIPALFTGKNIYCTYFCPFCGLQEMTHMLSRTNFPIGPYRKWIKRMKDGLLFVLIFIAFIMLNPSKVGIEPFGTVFGMNGSKFGWYLAFVVLVSSFFYKRLWCTAFCPVGAFLDKLALLGRSWRSKVSGAKKGAGMADAPIRDSEEKKGKQENKKMKVPLTLVIFYLAIAISIVFVLKENLF